MDVSVAYVWTTRGDSSLDFNFFISPAKRKISNISFQLNFKSRDLEMS